MSMAAISWVLSLEHDDPIEKFVLFVLANYADDYGVTWVSQGRIRKNCSCSERKVRSSLKSLEEDDLIMRVARRRNNGSRQSDLTILVGFPDRTMPSAREEHEHFHLLDAAAWGKVTTGNRHGVPHAATGSTCPTPGAMRPTPPAPRAVLEPLIEPLKELIPPTPRRKETSLGTQARFRPAQSAHGHEPDSGSWQLAFDQVGGGNAADDPGG